MKKILLGLMAAAITSIGCYAEGNKLHVKMNVKDVGDSITVISLAERESQHTFTGRQGVFDFEVEVPKATTLYLVEPQLLRGVPGANYRIPAVPGETVELTSSDESRYDVDGPGFYGQYHQADLVIEAAGKPLRDLTLDITAKMEAGASRDSLMKVYQEQMPILQKKVSDAIMEYIKAHPNEEVSAAIIPQLQDLDQMKAAVKLLSASVRDGRCKPLYQDIIDEAEASQKLEAESAQKQAAGMAAPDFELNDINGKPLKLSSLRGKYVILDFWGSWCGWCIKGFPAMKEAYKKHAGKFEILGIDCNDPETKWKDAVKKHELPWLHVYNPRSSSVLSDYGVTGFPTKIIIDPEGKIVKSIVGEDPAFYTLLDELFK